MTKYKSVQQKLQKKSYLKNWNPPTSQAHSNLASDETFNQKTFALSNFVNFVVVVDVDLADLFIRFTHPPVREQAPLEKVCIRVTEKKHGKLFFLTWSSWKIPFKDLFCCW